MLVSEKASYDQEVEEETDSRPSAHVPLSDASSNGRDDNLEQDARSLTYAASSGVQYVEHPPSAVVPLRDVTTFVRKALKCKICCKTFKCKVCLKKHMRAHRSQYRCSLEWFFSHLYNGHS